MNEMEDNLISLKEYLNEKMARIDDKLARLDEQIESNRAQIAQQRIEDKNALEVRLAEHQAAHDREHITAEKNAEKDEKKLDTRLLGMNEIREQLNTQAATFARLDYVDAKVTGLSEKLEQSTTNLEARRESAVTVLTARLDSVEKTLISLTRLEGIAASNQSRISTLETNQNLNSGERSGSKQTVNYALAALAAIGTIVGLLSAFALLFNGR